MACLVKLMLISHGNSNLTDDTPTVAITADCQSHQGEVGRSK